MDKKPIDSNRRRFLTGVGVGTAGIIAASPALGKALCDLPTPDQPEGPFYPEEFGQDVDTDLTSIAGSSKTATGQVVIIRGRVFDRNCKPVDGAIVEIWQACATGKYKHSRDTSKQPEDLYFQYYGKAATKDGGWYSFKTIKPGAYDASSNWVRPPHIHYKIHDPNHNDTLTTQMYFAGDAELADDRILESLTAAERKKLIVDFRLQEKNLVGRFDIFFGGEKTKEL